MSDDLAARFDALISVVESQEREIQVLKKQARRLEEHGKAYQTFTIALLNLIANGNTSRAEIDAALDGCGRGAEFAQASDDATLLFRTLRKMFAGTPPEADKRH